MIVSATIYRKSDALRIRPFEPWHAAMAYTPRAPALHWINSTAWLVLELCRDSTLAEITEQLGEVMPDKAEAAARACLDDLEQKGLIYRVTPQEATTKGDET